MLKIWKLKLHADRRFNSGHPWVYSNELAESPAGLPAGEEVELRDARGKFLARGYGNPASLIAFRAVSRDSKEENPLSFERILKRLQNALAFRTSLGLTSESHRLCFGEGDFLPGLVIDCYLLNQSPPAQVFVIQSHTAGIDKVLPELPSVLERLVRESAAPIPWERTAIVLRNDLGVRRLEGLTEEEPKILKEISGLSLTDTQIQVSAAAGCGAISFCVNLVVGQKTGFFLDQRSNVQQVVRQLESMPPDTRPKTEVRILDLCCYVGQWGTQLARLFCNSFKTPATVHAVDASAEALQFAKRNIEVQGARCEIFKADVLKDLGSLDSQSYDVVICDPPALIKSRKHLPQGEHAYLQLNTQALRLVKPGGVVVSCSCSALLEEEAFLRALSKASLRNQRVVRWIGRGFQAPDHPVLAEFPEGRYLKAWIGKLA